MGRKSSGVRVGGDVKGTGIAVGDSAQANVGWTGETAPVPAETKARSRLLIGAGVVLLAVLIGSAVLLAVGVVDIAIAGFIVAALAVAVAAVPLLRG